MSTSSLELVKEFHEKFGHPVNNKPWLHNDVLNLLRTNLLDEELKELEVALKNYNVNKTLDALCDLQVVLDGAFLALGFWPIKDEAMAEVMRSNMSKLGADGKPIYREDGKILKGPNYSLPDLDPILAKLYGQFA